MSGALHHSAAEVVRQLLVDLSQGVLNTTGPWSAYYSSMPDSPDKAFCVYDTEGRIQGRDHISGQMHVHHGIQIRVRDVTPQDSFNKADKICQALDGVLRANVNVGSYSYFVQAVTRTGSPIPLRYEGESMRSLHTINAVVALIEQSSGTG